jgi:2-keto-4-pentenoate hydratase/2-oxohepta-3-ene-1,7-dioic acid hydratase in catechol pathway
MKIASFKQAGGTAYGVVRDNSLIVASDKFRNRYPDLRNLLEAEALSELAADIEGRDSSLSIDQLQLLPPVFNAQRTICVGINYPKRYPLDDQPAPPPEHIILFGKLEGTLVGHGEALELPVGEAAETFDYEGEITLVIGKAGRHISAQQAFDHIAGYTVMNDGSVRGWQKHSVHAGKNFANSGACGPWMVTADEISDVESMRLSTRLNGEIVQDTTVAEMIFSIPELIAYISHTIDLKPGDLIATGSPEGSGGSRQPQRFLRAGDTLDIEVSGVGVLHNQVGTERGS